MNGGEISGFYQGGISVGKGAKFKLENGAISQILQGSDGGGGAINIVGGTATINGGTLSDSSQGIFNNSNLIMTGGDITGNQFGLINNKKDGMSGETFTPVAKLSGGSIANNEVYAIENYKGGTFTITGDAYVFGRATIKGTSDKNGWVTPALTAAKIGDSVDFTIKAYPGYRILDVKVNGVSVGAVSQYTLIVTGADVLEAQFVQASSSGGSEGSGGSGGSGRIVTGNSATMPSIPETPGARCI